MKNLNDNFYNYIIVGLIILYVVHFITNKG